MGIASNELCISLFFTDPVSMCDYVVFLELLEPYILNRELTSLSAEVMHAFVEHYAVLGKLKEVEQCILRMHMDSVDTNQIARLCQKHRLISALIYVYNRAFHDYESPIDEILGIVLNPNSRMPVHVRHVYLRSQKHSFCVKSMYFRR